MAKLRRVGASRKQQTCEKGHPIPIGDPYLYWQPRYGPKHVRCVDHPPRQSEMTTSKMAGVYAAIEHAEEAVPEAVEAEDFKQILEDCANEITEVIQEYRDSAESMGPLGSEMEEKADELEAFTDDLDQLDFEPFEDWKQSNQGGTREDWLEHNRGEINSALADVPG